MKENSNIIKWNLWEKKDKITKQPAAATKWQENTKGVLNRLVGCFFKVFFFKKSESRDLSEKMPTDFFKESNILTWELSIEN